MIKEQREAKQKVKKILMKPPKPTQEKVAKVPAPKGGMKRPRRKPEAAHPQVTQPKTVLWSQVLASVAAQYASASESLNGNNSQSSSSTAEPRGYHQDVIAVCDSDEDSQFALMAVS